MELHKSKEKRKIKRNIKKLLMELFIACVSAGAGSFVTFLFQSKATEIKYHDAVTYNNISSYIDSLIVQPGLIDENILLLDNPFEQINRIAETMTNQRQISESMVTGQQEDYDKVLAGIRECLINSGKNEILVNKYTQDELLNELDYIVHSVQNIRQENKDLSLELKDLKGQKTAILSSPDLKILGEDINTTLRDYIASIDGHIYYSENLLNTFLPEKITYDNEIIKYGENIPEKINVVSAGLIYDDSKFDFYNGGSHFTMGLQEYSNGIVKKSYCSGSLKIACNARYSQLSFTLGHIDNSGTDDISLSIFYMDSNGEYQETFFKNLYIDMPVESFLVPIYNTKTVKIDISYNTDGQYALADVYLIK